MFQLFERVVEIFVVLIEADSEKCAIANGLNRLLRLDDYRDVFI